VTTLDELTAVLREAVAQGKEVGSAQEYEERAARAQRHASMIRAIIEENAPTNLRRPSDPLPGEE
jgi:hypothetical protein